MIVVNGVLVLVALVLLVIGLAGDGLTVVYASIVVSVLALLSLLVGVLQRRGPAAGAAPAAVAGRPVAGRPVAGRPVAAPAPSPVGPGAPSQPGTAEPPLERDDELIDDEEEFGGLVAVVPGSPRYHVDGCPQLAGERAHELDVLDAREEGHTPCGTCRPDAVLADRAEQRSLSELRGSSSTGHHPPAQPAPLPPVAGPGHAGTVHDADDDPAGDAAGDLDAEVAGGEAPVREEPVREEPVREEPVREAAGDEVAGREVTGRDATVPQVSADEAAPDEAPRDAPGEGPALGHEHADVDAAGGPSSQAPAGAPAPAGSVRRAPDGPGAAPPRSVAAVRAVAGVARFIARDATARGAAVARRRAAGLQQRRDGGPASAPRPPEDDPAPDQR